MVCKLEQQQAECGGGTGLSKLRTDWYRVQEGGKESDLNCCLGWQVTDNATTEDGE